MRKQKPVPKQRIRWQKQEHDCYIAELHREYTRNCKIKMRRHSRFEGWKVYEFVHPGNIWYFKQETIIDTISMALKSKLSRWQPIENVEFKHKYMAKRFAEKWWYDVGGFAGPRILILDDLWTK